MAFKTLLRFRESQGLSVEIAANRCDLSSMEYADRESGDMDLKATERLGMLVALGMDANEARLALESDKLDFRCELPSMRSLNEPHVFVENGEYVFVCRETCAPGYQISSDEVQSAKDVLAWIAHLLEKKWITTEHIRTFVALCFSELRLDRSVPSMREDQESLISDGSF